MFCFYKHMKFRNQARLCLAVFDFKVLDYRYKKTNSNVAAKCGYIFSDFY